MSPANLPLMESLIEYVLENGYALAQMMSVTTHHPNSRNPTDLPTEGLLAHSAYREER